MNVRRVLPWLVGAIALALGLLVAYASLVDEPGPKFEGVDITGAPWGKGFALTDHHGRKRTLENFHGKAVALFFGYTHCPDMCPTTLALLGQAVRALGSDAGQVQGLFVTVDPRRDTPQVLSQYDRAGRIRLYLKPDAMSAESIARDLRTLLREGGS